MSAPIIDIDGLEKIMMSEETPFYIVKSSDGRTEVSKNFQSADIKTSYDRLKNTLEYIDGDFVLIELHNNNTSGRPGVNHKKLVFKYALKEQIQGITGVSLPAMIPNQFQATIDTIRDQLTAEKIARITDNYERQINDLRREIKESKEDTGQFDALAIIREITALKRGGAASPGKPITGAATNDRKKIAAQVAAWLNADPNAGELIELIARMARENKSAYLMYKEQFINAVLDE